MPNDLGQFNSESIYRLTVLSALVALIAVNAVFAFIGLIRKEKKRNKAFEIVVFTIDWVIIALGILYAALSIIRVLGGSVTITDEYILNVGEKSITVPLLSRLFQWISVNAVFSVSGVIAEAFALFAIIVQLVKWRFDSEKKRLIRKKDEEAQKRASEEIDGYINKVGDEVSKTLLSGEKTSAAVSGLTIGKTIEEEIIANFVPDNDRELMSVEEENECLDAIKPEKIVIKADKKERTCIIRNKIVVKSDAASVYTRYLEEKAARGRINE